MSMINNGNTPDYCTKCSEFSVIAGFYDEISRRYTGTAGAIVRVTEFLCLHQMKQTIDNFNKLTGFECVIPEVTDDDVYYIKAAMTLVREDVNKSEFKAANEKDSAKEYLDDIRHGKIKLPSDQIRDEAERCKSVISSCENKLAQAGKYLDAVKLIEGVMEPGFMSANNISVKCREIISMLRASPFAAEVKHAHDRVMNAGNAMLNVINNFPDPRSRKWNEEEWQLVKEYYSNSEAGKYQRDTITLRECLSATNRKEKARHCVIVDSDITLTGV